MMSDGAHVRSAENGGRDWKEYLLDGLPDIQTVCNKQK